MSENVAVLALLLINAKLTEVAFCEDTDPAGKAAQMNTIPNSSYSSVSEGRAKCVGTIES